MGIMRISSRVICTLLLVSLLCFQQFHEGSAHGGIDDGDGDPAPPPAAVESGGGLVGVKVWCLVILLVFTFVCGVSPYFYRWNEAFLVLGTQFAAGVFLGTSLMHFLADSADNFRALTKKHYPFAYMLACVGFLLTMLADCVIQAKTSSTSHISVDDDQEAAGRGGDNHHQQQQKTTDHHPTIMLVGRTSNVSDAVLLIVALCFHSVFEGIAIGVSASKSEAWRNLWTIGLHKIFAAVAMGIALLRLIPKRPLLTSVAYSLAFAVSSPVGVGIGIGVIGATPNSRAWVYAVSMGFATGVFVYVAINHLMAKGYRPQEPTRADRPVFKLLAVSLGVAVMAVAMIWD